jgi:SulP family sulfate permease
LADGEQIMTLGGWLTQALGCEAHAEKLMPLLERADLPAGTYICRQGDPTDNLIFIERGRVGVMIMVGGKECCARIFGPHTIAGEQGFVLQMPRSASLKVETDATIWSLSRKTYETLAERQSDIVIALMRDIIRLQSERLIFATRQAAALS